jgi:hypothetical protein
MKFNELPSAYPHQCIGEKMGTSALVAERCSMIIVLKDGWDGLLSAYFHEEYGAKW